MIGAVELEERGIAEVRGGGGIEGIRSDVAENLIEASGDISGCSAAEEARIVEIESVVTSGGDGDLGEIGGASDGTTGDVEGEISGLDGDIA